MNASEIRDWYERLRLDAEEYAENPHLKSIVEWNHKVAMVFDTIYDFVAWLEGKVMIDE